MMIVTWSLDLPTQTRKVGNSSYEMEGDRSWEAINLSQELDTKMQIDMFQYSAQLYMSE